MAKSRVSLKGPKAGDKRGADSIIRETINRVRASGSSAGGTSKDAIERKETVKTTVYLRADQITAVEEIQLQMRRRTGKKPDKYALAQEAFDLLIEKYSKD